MLGTLGRVGVRRGSGFGQAIAFDITQTVQLPQTLRHRLRHGCTAAADGGERTQVVAVKFRAAQQIDDHGGNIGPMADPPLRNQLPGVFPVPARHQHNGRTRINAGVHHRHHAGDVKQRHHAQSNVFVGGVVPHAAGHGVVHDAAVRVHAALGQSGGAAGVRQHRQVVRLHRIVGHRQAVLQNICPMVKLRPGG